MTFTDIVVCVLPIPMVFRMKLPLRQKLSVCGLFALGAIAVISGIVKLTKMPELLKSPDVAWNGTMSLVWLNIELIAAAIAGSGVALKIFVQRWVPSLLPDRGSPHGEEGGEENDGNPPTVGHAGQAKERPGMWSMLSDRKYGIAGEWSLFSGSRKEGSEVIKGSTELSDLESGTGRKVGAKVGLRKMESEMALGSRTRPEEMDIIWGANVSDEGKRERTEG